MFIRKKLNVHQLLKCGNDRRTAYIEVCKDLELKGCRISLKRQKLYAVWSLSTLTLLPC